MDVREAGIYRGQITDYGLFEADSGAVGINITANLTEQFVQDEAGGHWRDCSFVCEGTQWIIKKDGTANDLCVESLRNHANWDGSLLSIEGSGWQPKACQFVVKDSEYKGTHKLKIAFIRAYDGKPSGGGVGRERAAELQARFAGVLGSPATPQRPPSSDNDIPF